MWGTSGDEGTCAHEINTPRYRNDFSLFSTKIITMSAPKGPFRLVTVNNAPERAKRLIGRVADQLKDRYEIIHVDNCACKFTTMPLGSIDSRHNTDQFFSH